MAHANRFSVLRERRYRAPAEVEREQLLSEYYLPVVDAPDVSETLLRAGPCEATCGLICIEADILWSQAERQLLRGRRVPTIAYRG